MSREPIELEAGPLDEPEAPPPSATVHPIRPDGDIADTDGWRADEVLARAGPAPGALPPLVADAAPLLDLAYELRHRDGRPNLAALREASFAAAKRYERDLGLAGASPEHGRAAHYIVCATVDDIVMSKPWGRRGEWARSGLVSTFHMDVTGGERVFDLLDHFHRDPGSNRDLLLLLYLCLSLGFEGRTRVSPRGALELGQVREGLYKTLRGQFGAFERELSPHWRGVSARHEPLKTSTRLWLLLGLLVLFLAAGYLLTAWLVSRSADTTLTALAGLSSGAAPSLRAPPEPEQPAAAEPQAPPPVVEAVEVGPDPLDTIFGFLEPEVQQGLVSLTRGDNSVLVRLRSSGLFDEGSARIGPEFAAIIDRIGRAIADEGLSARVIGHTDDTPIATARYPSNWQLSQARADAVRDSLVRFVPAGKVTSEGRADTEPIATNATAEGRELNRRTEILVIGRASATRRVPRAENVR